MIYSINGVLAYVEPNFVVVECGGLGYGVRTTMNTIGRLPPVGEKVQLYTQLNVREDAIELFGFLDKTELDCFKMLGTVNGVGPKAAIAILSEFTPERFMLCVAGGDAKSITRAQGVGPKLANRIVLELKDKISNEDLSAGMSGGANVLPLAAAPAGEALGALLALGYNQSEAASVLAKLDASMPVQELIKQALKLLSTGR